MEDERVGSSGAIDGFAGFGLSEVEIALEGTQTSIDGAGKHVVHRVVAGDGGLSDLREPAGLLVPALKEERLDEHQRGRSEEGGIAASGEDLERMPQLPFGCLGPARQELDRAGDLAKTGPEKAMSELVVDRARTFDERPRLVEVAEHRL